MKTRQILSTLILGLLFSVFANGNSTSESHFQSVVGTRGMVVSDDQQASEWGVEILKRGGNAIDAAVATAFVLAVTRPHYASLGGGGFLMYCPHSTPKGPSTCQALDYREKAPTAAQRDMFLHSGKANTQLSQNGALASGVPGVPAGLLTALEKFGTMPRQKLLSRPIEIASRGYRFTALTEEAATGRWPYMNDAAHEIFGCSSKEGEKKTPCPPGTLIRQTDLAQTLKMISSLGHRGFYEGLIAEKIVRGIRNSGGIITLEDLKTYQPQFRSVLQGEFQGMEIVAMPPPSAGGALLLQLLGYAERAGRSGAFKNGLGSADTIHALSYSMSLSFADRAQYFGDPDFVKIPLQTLLSLPYLDQQWKSFQPDRAIIPAGPGKVPGTNEPQHTTHFSVIDREGNAVAITTTVNDDFGSGFVPPGTGVVMNNEMDDFRTQPGVPNLFGLVGAETNSIASNKRPLSSMTPTIVRDPQGSVRIVIGAAGGPKITTSVFLSLFNRLQLGMSLTDAVAAPRFHQQWKPEQLKIEKYGFPFEVQTALKKKGYILEESLKLGKVHALERLPNGRVIGVPDPRGEGVAVAE